MPADDRRGADSYVPDSRDLDVLRAAVDGCRGCDLYRDATRGVLGAGPPTARLVLVGEQPGDQEDRQGEPFVGLAGRLLDRALADAGIARQRAYLTNAVKHASARTSPTPSSTSSSGRPVRGSAGSMPLPTRPR